MANQSVGANGGRTLTVATWSIKVEDGVKKICHIVLVKFRADKMHRMPELLAALEALQKLMPGLLSIQGGPYSSPEGLNQGYTHGLVVTFANAAARDHYLVHPDHEKLKQAFLPDLEAVVAFDFEVN